MSQINTPRFEESDLDKKYRKSSQKKTAFNRPKKDIWTLQQEMPSQLIEMNEVYKFTYLFIHFLYFSSLLIFDFENFSIFFELLLIWLEGRVQRIR